MATHRRPRPRRRLGFAHGEGKGFPWLLCVVPAAACPSWPSIGRRRAHGRTGSGIDETVSLRACLATTRGPFGVMDGWRDRMSCPVLLYESLYERTLPMSWLMPGLGRDAWGSEMRAMLCVPYQAAPYHPIPYRPNVPSSTMGAAQTAREAASLRQRASRS